MLTEPDALEAINQFNCERKSHKNLLGTCFQVSPAVTHGNEVHVFLVLSSWFLVFKADG